MTLKMTLMFQYPYNERTRTSRFKLIAFEAKFQYPYNERTRTATNCGSEKIHTIYSSSIYSVHDWYVLLYHTFQHMSTILLDKSLFLPSFVDLKSCDFFRFVHPKKEIFFTIKISKNKIHQYPDYQKLIINDYWCISLVIFHNIKTSPAFISLFFPSHSTFPSHLFPII